MISFSMSLHNLSVELSLRCCTLCGSCAAEHVCAGFAVLCAGYQCMPAAGIALAHDSVILLGGSAYLHDMQCHSFRRTLILCLCLVFFFVQGLLTCMVSSIFSTSSYLSSGNSHSLLYLSATACAPSKALQAAVMRSCQPLKVTCGQASAGTTHVSTWQCT